VISEDVPGNGGDSDETDRETWDAELTSVREHIVHQETAVVIPVRNSGPEILARKSCGFRGRMGFPYDSVQWIGTIELSFISLMKW
jgi:hypothetical protein